MNLSLVDPFVLAQDCPETLVGSLHCGHSTCIRFNRRGDLLASGRNDGTIVIFDLETNGVARKLRGHTRQIQSLSWSVDGRYLLSSSRDWKCILWDLKDGSRVKTVRFEAPLFIAELHPYNHLVFVVALFENQPELVDITGEVPVRTTLASAPKRALLEGEVANEKQLAQDAKQTTTVTTFSACGNFVLAGTSKGWLNVIDVNTHRTCFSTRLASAVIMLIRLSPSGRDIVVNAGDGIIRTLRLPNLEDEKLDFENFNVELEHKFQDIVDHLSWNHVTFSSNGEYVVASIFMNHMLHIWERRHGSLQKILVGPKEELSAVEWHPYKPFIAVSGVELGNVYLWSIVTPQRWSALAPDFAEVEENVEYIEREDEFDIHPIEEIHKRILHQEDEEIDVLTIEPATNGFEDDSDFKMPIIFNIQNSDSEDDMVAIGAGQYRKKSPGQNKQWMVEDENGVLYSGDDRSTPKRSISGAGANGATKTSHTASSRRRKTENE